VAFVSDQSDGGDCPEVITRTYSVTDDCGNETLVTQLIIIGGGLVPIPTVTANSPICEGEDAVFTINGLADAVVTYDTGLSPQTLTLFGGTAVVTVPAVTSDITITLSNIADGTCSSFINETAIVVVTTPETPTFTQLGPSCQGDSPGVLQAASFEGIVGTWSPNVIDPLLIGTTTYTFTPDPGQCASETIMEIEITAPTIPTFTQIDDLCEGAEVFPGGSPFPVASTEGIIGVWAPVFDAFNTTTYTFTPDPAFCATTTTMTINIVGFPVVGAGGDQIITCNNNVDGAQIGSPDVPGNVYSWSPTTGLSNPNIANPIANPSTATTYTLTVTNSTGCSSEGTVNVAIDDTPPIVTITNNSGSSTLTCTQLDISVTATGADSYTWDNGLGNNASATITSPGIYTVTGTSLNGCESTQSIEIIQDNNVDLFVVLSDPEICSGEDVLITANSANATGFDWVVVQNSVSGAAAGTISNTASGAEIIQTLQLTGVNNGSVEYTITPTLGGCIGASQTVVVDVIAPFIPQFDVLGPFCIDDTPTSLPLVSNSGITGTWNPTTISTATAGTSTYIFTPNPNQCAISQNIDVTVNDLPVVSFSADNLGGCAPLLVNLTSANGSGTWTISNGEVFDGTQVQLNLLNPGCYDVTLEIQQGGCSNALTESDFLCVELNPVADFTATPDVFTDQDVLVSFTNLSSGASSFLWEFGDENTSTYINPSNLYEYTEEGALITLTAISEFGCTDQAQLIIEYEEQEVFYIPNTFTPDGDNFNQMFTPVFYSGFDPFNFEMLIFNRWGEIVFETRNAEIGWDGTYGLNGMKASDGAYTWKITYKNPKTDQRKVIVGHVTLIR
jgi:gliding motility-associated-like protein